MNKKKLMALLLTGVMAASTVSVPVFAEEAEGGSSDTPLVIGQTNFSEKFSGLFHEAVPDQQIAENVGEALFGSDRTGAIIYNGIEGETHEYNGTDYTYTGLSDVTVTEGEDETVYNFKLREDVTFSDGEPLTADDLIFTYYVLSDTDYDGNATFYSTNIKGIPEGAKMTYEIIIGADGSGDHPSFAILTDAKAALESIGFTLEINDVTDSNIMWDALNAGTAEMWAAAWQATVDPDMYQVYHSASVKSNYYHINDETLDQDIIDARSTAEKEYRKSVYKQCLDIILDWAVEIPIYQRQNCVIYSPERINADTFTKDVTTFYPWYGDIINIEMN